jgi:hypothetical protein
MDEQLNLKNIEPLKNQREKAYKIFIEAFRK